MNLDRDRRVQELISKREYGEAQRLIDQRKRERPGDADAHYLEGVSLHFQGRLAEAAAALRKALEIDPRHTDAAVCLSVLFNDIGRYDEAKGVFALANRSVAPSGSLHDREIDRKFAVKHFETGDLYFRYRRYDEAIGEYAKAANLDPQALEIRIRLAKSYAKKGFVSRAIQELQVLKREHPRFVPARVQLGLLHCSQGNLLDAELEWEGALQVDPSNAEAKTCMELARSGKMPKGE